MWIHYDEKWFYGLVTRMAKQCKALGLNKQQRFAYHKNHINKIMAIAVIGFAFEGTPENGGHGVKLAFTRCQAAKIAKKMVRAYSGKVNGSNTYRGEVIRRRGDAYMVDANVTGSNAGTSDDRKFDLKTYFNELVLDQVEDLVHPQHGQFPGYTPVMQGDKAGPHEEDEFVRWIKEECKKRKILWEPQAPQMPHMNALDLAVFPSMSKAHSTMIRRNGKMVASKDVIFTTASSVWHNMPAATIAKAFVHAWRIAEVVIRNKGSNTFLRTKEFHTNIRKDFDETRSGVAPKQ